MTLRLQKYLAQCGLCSRRRAEELIAAGRVMVDGRVVTAMGTQIDPGLHQVSCDGQPVLPGEQTVTYLLNKPAGYVTTLADPQGRPTVVSLLKEVLTRVFPVGRLDLDTEGALLLTNDGELAQKIQHPSHGVKKTYEALVAGRPSPGTIAQLERGVPLEGKMTAPASLQPLAQRGEETLIRITIHEGRKRQIKMMFRLVGHPVRHLRRTAYGRLTLGDLAIGRFRELNPSDLKKIFL